MDTKTSVEYRRDCKQDGGAEDPLAMRTSVVRPPWDGGGAGPGAKTGADLGYGLGSEVDS